MGSFNVACGLSNLSINEGDKIGFVILDDSFTTRTNERDRNKAAPQGQSMLIYADSLYTPVLPPIYGQYGDYGRVKKIVKSSTTKFLENMFDRPIKTILACISSHRSLYSTNGEIWKHYAIKNPTMEIFQGGMHEQILSLGFVEAELQEEQEKAYSFGKYRITRAPRQGWSIWKEDAAHPFISGSGAHDAADFAEFFSTHTNLYPGFKPEDYSRVAKLHRYSGMFFLEDVFTQMQDALEDDFFVKRDIKEFDENWDDFIKTFDYSHIPTSGQYGNSYSATAMDKYRKPEDGPRRRFASAWSLKTNEFISRNMKLNPEDYDLLHVFKDDYSFKEIYHLKRVSESLNRYFGPTMNGDQYGNDGASAALNKITDRILTSRKEDDWDTVKYEEDEDED